jgi:hypothetical protein
MVWCGVGRVQPRSSREVQAGLATINGAEQRQKEGRSFLKKITKILFCVVAIPNISVHGLDLSAGAGAKVFWFFSSEKNVLPS